MNTLKVIGAKAKKVSYHEGTYWKSDTGCYYILACLAGGFHAVNIQTGNHWNYNNHSPEEAVDGLSFVGDVEITLKESN
jgi:hypothetical protein